jgi:serpin B
MPRFTLSFKTQLTGFLEGLGIRRVFSPLRSQLVAMVAHQRLFLAFVAHAARLKVDETGTTAAAATAGGVSASAVARPVSTILKLNHPFLVLIRDTRTGAVLFAARLLDPAGETG